MSSKEVTHVDELFVNRFIKAGLLNGNKHTYTIKHVNVEQLEGDKGLEWKGIATFEETDLQWTLNKTNVLCIKAMFSELVPNWYGKRVVLFPTKDRFGREIVDCIRVWGSPDIDRDITVEIKFPKKKPVKMTMHKGTDQSQTRPAARPEPTAEPVAEPAATEPAPAKFKFSPRGRELLNQMAATTDPDMLFAFPVAINAEANMSPDEQGRLLQLVEKRRQQILTTPPQVASEDAAY
jgi:hypothetical protein